jgi:hypothetical protein
MNVLRSSELSIALLIACSRENHQSTRSRMDYREGWGTVDPQPSDILCGPWEFLVLSPRLHSFCCFPPGTRPG